MFVRALDEKDWEIFKAIRLEALSLHKNNFSMTYEQSAKESDEYWKNTLIHDNKRIFGLFDGDTLIGIGGVFTDKDDASSKTAILGMGYIKEAYRGRKLSRLIYQARIDWARESGSFERIAVSHRKGNDASMNANQAFGFKYIGEERKKFGDDKEYTDVKYELRIP